MTLVEILIVIAILAVLSVAIGFGVMKFLASGKEKACKLQLDNLRSAIRTWAADNSGEFPEDLNSLTTGKMPVLTKKKLKDPWGSVIRYTKVSGGEPVLCSNGPDKQEGTDDDICTGKEGEEE
ncbi:MAG: type II secretion system protein GspG [Myxococcales bacterium]|nr:type II secretion system protein GspG [Myxococcales bacterium]